MPATVTHAPDFSRLWEIIDEELTSALVDGGLKVIQDMSSRIDREVDLNGRKQKPNSPAYAKWKKAHRGHTVPLRRGDIRSGVGPGGEQLRDPHRNYRLNGVEVHALGRRPPMPHGALRVRLQLPLQRVQIAAWLEQRGYRLPWGVSGDTRRWIKQRLLVAVRLAKGRFAQVGGDPTSITATARSFRGRAA